MSDLLGRPVTSAGRRIKVVGMGVSHSDGHYSVLLKLIIIIGRHHVQEAPRQASVNGRRIVKIQRCCDSEDHKEVHSEHEGITEGGHGGDVSKARAQACSGSKNLQ